MLKLKTLETTKQTWGGGGRWISGVASENGKDLYNYEALVFAENSIYSLDDSKISKLWIRRIADRKTVFNFDRGLDVGSPNPEVEWLVLALSEELSA